MIRRATAVAHPNIALAKYWGKAEGEGNVPAVPSLSVTLSLPDARLATTTTVTFGDSFTEDTLVLNGTTAEGRPLERVVALLDRVRAEAKTKTRAHVTSSNDFPTASGLASSASGFAALALASTRALGLDWPAERVADCARRSSASAARSIFGGFVELDAMFCRAVAPPSTLDLRVLVAVTTEAQKATSSTDGMILTQKTSPYYKAWLEDAPRNFRAMRAALLEDDFVRVGELAERSALAMHACAMAAGVVYVGGGTLAALAEVRAMRAAGMAAYATMDAGPHLKCLVRAADAEVATARLAAVPGVLRVLVASPAEGATVRAEREETP